MILFAALAALVGAPSLVQASTGTVGPGEPSGDGVEPVLVLSNPSCATLNADNVRFPSVTSNWGFKINGSPNGTFTLTNPPGELTGGAPSYPGQSVTISNSDGIYFDWAATLGIDAVIVKGGPNSDAFVYDPEDLADTDLHPPVNPNNHQYYGISHIEFCFDGGDAVPKVTTKASGGGEVGSPTHDTATLSGGPAGTYSGTLTFQLFKNDSCSGTPAFTVTKAVTAGNGDYDSPSVTPTEAGTYYWVAKFTSSTSGVPDSARTACNDPAEKVTITEKPPPPPEDPKTDLEIHKTADKNMEQVKASPGQKVTYTFTVKNNGPGVAHDVTITDPLPHDLIFVSADPRCSYAAGMLECDLGTLQPGETVTLEVVLQLAPWHTSDAAPNDHQWDIQKVEAFQALQAGETGEWSLSCPSGYSMMDGSARVDSVDQGTGGIAAVETLTSKSDPASKRSWLFKVDNGTSGQAQMHVFGVCVAERSTSADGHTHGTQVSAPIAATDSFGAGRHSRTLTCPTDTYAVAPGFRWISGSGSQYLSESSPDGRSWTFGFEQGAAGSVETSVRCLKERTTTDDGHFEILELSHAHAFPTVAPGDVNSSQPYSDQRVSCGDDEKAIVGTFELPAGVTQHGSTPEPKVRDFRILNASGESREVHIDALCLGIRIGDFGNGGSVINTACVYGDEPDPNHANDCSSYVLEDPPGPVDPPVDPPVTVDPPVDPPVTVDPPASEPGSARYDGPARLLRRALLVELSCVGDTACSDTATVTARAGGKRLKIGSRSFELAAGEATTLRFDLGRKLKRKLKKAGSVRVELAKGADAKLRLER